MSSEMSGEPYFMLTVQTYKLRVIVRNCVSFSSEVQTQCFVRTVWNTGLVLIRLVWSRFEYKAEYLALPKDLEFIPGFKKPGALR